MVTERCQITRFTSPQCDSRSDEDGQVEGWEGLQVRTNGGAHG